MAKRRTKKAEAILDDLIGDDRELHRSVEKETIHSHVASLVYEARTRARLTQAQLAELIGTQQSVIARLEHSDYEGHSLSMLIRIAEALDQRIEIRFVPHGRARPTG